MKTTVNVTISFTHAGAAQHKGKGDRKFHLSNLAMMPNTGDYVELEFDGTTYVHPVVERRFKFEEEMVHVDIMLDIGLAQPKAGA